MARTLGWLGALLLVAQLAVLPAPGHAASLAQVQNEVGQLETLVRQARFRHALAQAPGVRARALTLPPSELSRSLVIRSEIAAGTAALALGQEGEARQCFQRALRLDRQLSLPANAPPKLRRSFDAARAGVP
jgi:hypothetical protein